MLTIALIAQKGGTGKTTVARCLAVAFERSVQASAIIDMDPRNMSRTARLHKKSRRLISTFVRL